MKSKKLSKQQTELKLKQMLSNNPSPLQIKKAKKLAMSKKIKLGSLRKIFCKKCLNFFNSNNSEIRIKKPFKIIKCKNCNYVSRYKLF